MTLSRKHPILITKINRPVMFNPFRHWAHNIEEYWRENGEIGREGEVAMEVKLKGRKEGQSEEESNNGREKWKEISQNEEY
jgi:hypothetical protein